jgi:IS5 family transposase
MLEVTIQVAMKVGLLKAALATQVNVDTTVQEKAIAFPTDARLDHKMPVAHRLMAQTRTSKNKIYSIHAPEVECIAKGKAHKRYEFGCKASFVTSSKNNWIVGARALHGNPYDGHTLAKALEQTERLTGVKLEDAVCDQDYRGHNYAGQAKVHVVRYIPRKAKQAFRRMLRRRSAIEPSIGHMKTGNRLDRNYLTAKKETASTRSSPQSSTTSASYCGGCFLR